MINSKRTPRNYDGTRPTGKRLNDLLSAFAAQLEQTHEVRPDLILAAWREVIGEKLAPMTEALSYQEGILTVKVKNSTLYSLLVQHERARLVQSLRTRFPASGIKNITFRIG